MVSRVWPITLTLALSVVSCGGDSKTATVVETVTQQAPVTQTSPAVDPGPSGPAVANLPNGAVAVQGRYRMRIVRMSDNSYITGDEDGTDEGAEREWVAEMACQDVCRVRLRRELKNGSYERTTLDPGVDERSFGKTTRIRADLCVTTGGSTGIVTKRISLRVSAVEERGGQQTAKRLDGHVSFKQSCRLGGSRLLGRANVVLRGTLDG